MNEVQVNIKTFFEVYGKSTVDKGAVVLLPGEPVATVMYIESGSIEQLAITDKGERVVVNVFREGAFMPLAYAMSGIENTYFFEASETSVVRRAPAADVIGFLQRSPDVLFDLLNRVYRGSDGILRLLVELMSGDAYSLLTSRLVIEARRAKMGDTDVILPLSESVLATRTGLSRETVSRELQKMKKRELVSLGRAKITIHSIKALEEAVGSR